MTVVKQGKPRLFSTGNKVINAGEIADCMYIVCSGTLSCKIEGREVKRLSTGESFGEMSLYFDFVKELFEEHKSILGGSEILDQT
jgi:hypothetical protein